jgi:hypothetical protein
VFGGSEPNPYLAPSDAGAVEVRAPAEFIDQSALVLALAGMLGVQLVLCSFNTFACMALYTIELDPVREATLVHVTGWAAWVDRVMYLLTLAPFGFFLVRANKNARTLSGSALGFTPGSMVWWFAVPLLNLVRPYQAVRAVWEASSPDTAPTASNARIITAWWVLWLVSSIGWRLGPILTKSEPAVHNAVTALTNAATAGVVIAALLMIRALDARQRQFASALDSRRRRFGDSAG